MATSQSKPELPGGLAFKTLALGQLSPEHKRQIFRFHACNSGKDDHQSLEGFSTAYGIAVAGRTFRAGQPQTAAHLYDSYVSQMSPVDFVSVSAAFFRECAALMNGEVSYSLERDRFALLLEDFVNRGQLPLALLDKIQKCSLLAFSGDLVHFEHDLLRDYFVAEVLRRECTDILQLADELKRPKHQSIVQFICARFRSESEVDLLLRSAENPTVLREAIQGTAGKVAQDVVRKHIHEFFSTAMADLHNISLTYKVVEREHQRPYAAWPTVIGNRSWSAYEELLCAVAAENVENSEITSLFLDLMDMTEWTLRKAANSVAQSLHVGPRGAWAEVLRISHFEKSVLTIPLLRILSILRSATMLDRGPVRTRQDWLQIPTRRRGNSTLRWRDWWQGGVTPLRQTS